MQTSKYRPVTPSVSGEAASGTEVAAPCSMFFQDTSVLVASNEAGLLVMSPM
ncbi:hypothetical protein [Streptomyces sp. NPDC005262]|uniref:hypothetical protein n=1 Tax=Streptomyces sp. NPDC005262 TaxID=3364710 RepID=UPI0036CBD084